MRTTAPPRNSRDVPPLVSVGAGLAISAAFVVLRLLATPVLGDRLPYSLSLLGIVLSAYYFRLVAGITATIVAIGATEILVLRHSFGPFTMEGAVPIVTIALVGTALSLVCDRMGKVLDAAADREQEAAENAQHSNEAFMVLDSILENAPLGIALLDHEGRFLRMNQRTATVAELTDPAEAIGQRPSAIFAEFGQSLDKAVGAALERGEQSTIEELYVSPPANRSDLGRWYKAIAFPTYDEAGARIGAAILMVDITEQKHHILEKEALLDRERMARGEAEKAGRMKDDFVATLSHELRTPLTSIFGWLELIRRKPEDSEIVADGITAIEKSTKVQLKMVEDLLDMSRISSGKLALSKELVGADEVANVAVNAIQPLANEQQITVQTVVQTESSIYADPARMSQVLTNLLTNAIKYSPRGSLVVVEVAERDGSIEYVVRDQGEGIEPAFLPFIFDRFQQGQTGITRKHGGLGIGLAIVKQLVDMHGGKISAESEGPGHGSTFTVRIPVSHTFTVGAPLQEIPDQKIELEPDGLQGIKVVLVDDDAETRSILGKLLMSFGADVMAADSAATGFALVRSERPDIVLSDIGMPDEDGYSLLRRIRELDEDEGGNVPAVAITAFARLEDRRQALLAGFQAHVTKPVDVFELVSTVRNLAG